MPPTGLITGNFPPADGETSYYFAVFLTPGDFVTQTSFLGRPGRDKSLGVELKDPKGKLLGYYTLIEGLAANGEAARVFPIDSSGRYTVVVKTKGPETTSFQMELGGSAFARQQAVTPAPAQFSRSYLAPTPLAKDGVITGTAPGGEAITTYYYFAADLKAGDLLTQISFAGRPDAPKSLGLSLLDSKGRPEVNSSYSIMGGLAANEEKTRTFPIDSSGRYILRVGVSGVQGTKFKVEFGGSAYPAAY